MHSITKHIKAILTLTLSLYFTAPSLALEIAVIAHNDNPNNAITAVQLERLYLGKAKALPNGDLVEVIDQSEHSNLRAAVQQEILRKSNSALASYWSRMLFTGRARPPRSIGDDESIKAYIQKRPHAIAYIDAKNLDDSVKALLIISIPNKE